MTDPATPASNGGVAELVASLTAAISGYRREDGDLVYADDIARLVEENEDRILSALKREAPDA